MKANQQLVWHLANITSDMPQMCHGYSVFSFAAGN